MQDSATDKSHEYCQNLDAGTQKQPLKSFQTWIHPHQGWKIHERIHDFIIFLFYIELSVRNE